MGHTLHITRHAAQRAVERHGGQSLAHARARLRRYFRRAIKLPWRHARHLIVQSEHDLHRVGKADVRVAGPCLLVCRGKTVVTTWRLSPEELATVLCWVATGWWFQG